MQVLGLIHRDAYAEHDGIDRAIKLCFAATAAGLILMRLLIDGPAWTRLARSGSWDEIHLTSFPYQSTEMETWIMLELSFHCYSECRVSVLVVVYPPHEECSFSNID